MVYAGTQGLKKTINDIEVQIFYQNPALQHFVITVGCGIDI
jgi:hypothetical protein